MEPVCYFEIHVRNTTLYLKHQHEYLRYVINTPKNAPFINITGIWSLSPLLSVKIVHIVDRSDLFKISNLVYDGREFVRSPFSSLQGQRVLWWV